MSTTEIAHPYICDCSYPGQPAEHLCCSECGDDWDECDCAARLRVGDRVAYDGHSGTVTHVLKSGPVSIDFSAGPRPWPFYTGPYEPDELERLP